MARPTGKSVCTGSRLLAVALAATGLLIVLLLVRRWTGRPRENRAGSATQANLFYVHMEGCAHCLRFDAVWTAFEDRYRTSLEDVGVSPRRIRSDDAQAKRLGITGYPSILLVSTTGAFPPRVFEGQRTPANLASFVKESFPAFVA